MGIYSFLQEPQEVRVKEPKPIVKRFVNHPVSQGVFKSSLAGGPSPKGLAILGFHLLLTPSSNGLVGGPPEHREASLSQDISVALLAVFRLLHVEAISHIIFVAI
jgi:hypothetical protein